MTTSRAEKTLSLVKAISNNLAFRHSADYLFNYINTLNESKIAIDFTGIESISRSFAHQFVINKNKSNKQIICCGMPPDIAPMFELVNRQISKQRNSATLSDEPIKIVDIPRETCAILPMC